MLDSNIILKLPSARQDSVFMHPIIKLRFLQNINSRTIYSFYFISPR